MSNEASCADAIGPEPAKKAPALAGTVLVVGDEEANVRLLTKLLTREGYDVRTRSTDPRPWPRSDGMPPTSSCWT